MLEMLQLLDEKILLLINGSHNAALDWFFFLVSEKWIWIPLYLYLFYLYYKNYPGKIIYVIIAITILIILTDQTASTLLKNLVTRLRPCHNPALAEKIHLVRGYCGGTYGFVSSHAANSFALATFFFCTLGRKFFPLALGLFLWATLVAFSRIYLGVHYPGDVLCGALVGALYAWLMQRLFLSFAR